MKNNLDLQLNWLRSNLQLASLAGFERVKATTTISNENCTFSFENMQGGNRTSSVLSLGTGGNYDLENFRTTFSPISLQSIKKDSTENRHCQIGNSESFEESIPDRLLLEIDLTEFDSIKCKTVSLPIAQAKPLPTSDLELELDRLNDELETLNNQIRESIRRAAPNIFELKQNRAKLEAQIEQLSFRQQDVFNNCGALITESKTKQSHLSLESDAWCTNEYNPMVINGPSSENIDIPHCNCGNYSVLRQTRSDGRKFFCCAFPRDSVENCNFFQWLLEESTVLSNSSKSNVMRDHKYEIKHRFGHKDFRQGQLACVEAALNGSDVFCLMPTGGGKSIVYQLPAWCCAGIAVVFSPLISLIQDQVDAMVAIGIRAVFLSAVSEKDDSFGLLSELQNYCYPSRSEEDERNIKLLYVTPEKFSRSGMLQNLLYKLYRGNLLSRFVIDEAHCLSQWGHDFRPDYLSLTKLRELYPAVPIMALTATANQSVVKDCMQIMKMNSPFIHTQSFNRSNLRYIIKKKLSDKKKLIEEIGSYILNRKDQSGIIYCLSRKDTEEVAEELLRVVPSLRHKITFYHAELNNDEKDRRQRAWSKGDVKVICATIAFGMGINKPDVRYVIHHSMPKSLTNYYQESGRAGRDGVISECILFFSYKDKSKLSSMILKLLESDEFKRMGAGERQKIVDNTNRSMHSLNKCVSYCLNEVECRRVLLLEYFGESFPSAACQGTCDNCKYRMEHVDGIELVDQTSHAKSLANIVKLILNDGKLQNLTLIKLAKLYAQSKDKDLSKYHEIISLNNGFTHPPVTRDSAETIIQHMITKGYFKEVHVYSGFNNFGADHITIGDRIDYLLRSQETLTIGYRKKQAALTNRKEKQSTKPHKQFIEIMETSDEEKSFTDSEKHTGTSHVIDKEQVNSHCIESGNESTSDVQTINAKRRHKKRKSISDVASSGELSSSQKKPFSKNNSESLIYKPNYVQPSLLSNKQKSDFTRWLEEYRKIWPNYWNYLNNSCVGEIVEKLPVTLDELASIPGIGDSKAQKHGEGILATIYAFLESRDLLHLFPNAKAPTIIECPTWKDPISEKAQEIRSKDTLKLQL